MSLKSGISCLALVALLTACTTDRQCSCITRKSVIETQLYFGLSKKNGVVTPEEWQNFVAREIAPRFPEGFTVVDGNGFWLGKETKKTISENSKIVIRVHEDNENESKNIEDIIEHYKHDFEQEAVMRLDTSALINF